MNFSSRKLTSWTAHSENRFSSSLYSYDAEFSMIPSDRWNMPTAVDESALMLSPLRS